MGQKLVAIGRALGILLAIWGVLLAVAYVADALPSSSPEVAEAGPDPDGTEAEQAPEEGAAESASEGEAVAEAPRPSEEPDDPSPPDGEPGDDSTESAAGAAPPAGPAIAPRRHTLVCEDVEHARIGVGSIVGDDAPEQIVVCGREAQVLAVHEGKLARLATLRLEGESQVRTAPPLVTDLNADGLADLVLGWTFLDGEGGPDGGTLHWVSGDPSGGFGEASVLQPLSVVDLVGAELDGRPGSDLVALHWADGFGRRPSEAWVFGGGPSPRRLARRRLRHDGVAVEVADVTGDESLDLITIDAEGVQIAEGDGSGRFPRFRSIPLEAGTAAVRVPAAESTDRSEGEGTDDDSAPPQAPVRDRVYLFGTTVITLDAAGEPTTVPAPAGVLRAVALPDGRVVALTRQRVVSLSESAPTLVDLPGTFRPADIALLPGEDAPVLLVLGRTAAGWELIEAPLGGGEVRLEPGATPGQVVQAPLVLNLVLH